MSKTFIIPPEGGIRKSELNSKNQPRNLSDKHDKNLLWNAMQIGTPRQNCSVEYQGEGAEFYWNTHYTSVAALNCNRCHTDFYSSSASSSYNTTNPNTTTISQGSWEMTGNFGNDTICLQID